MANEKIRAAQAATTEAVGPKVGDLTNKFKEQSIPLEVDFQNLIEIADVGRKAVGLSADQPNNRPGDGIEVTGDGKLQVKGNTALGIKVDSDGVAVNYGRGLQITEGKLYVEVKDGVEINGDHLTVKAGPGITVNSSGVSLDVNSILPPGMIMMFSGEKIPSGWEICDGNEGRPNLVDKFILGGTVKDLGGKNSIDLSGDKNSKAWTASTDSQKPEVKVTIMNHKLTKDQIPSHNHRGGLMLSGTDRMEALYKYNVASSGGGAWSTCGV